MEAIPHVQAFAVRLTRDREKGLDLAQQALVLGWAKLDQYTPGTRMTAWLFSITRNAYYDNHRRRRREVEDPDGTYAAGLATRPRAIDTIQLMETIEAIEHLVPAHQEAIAMAVAGLDIYAQARGAGVPLGTAKSRLNRARKALTERLGGEDC